MHHNSLQWILSSIPKHCKKIYKVSAPYPWGTGGTISSNQSVTWLISNLISILSNKIKSHQESIIFLSTLYISMNILIFIKWNKAIFPHKINQIMWEQSLFMVISLNVVYLTFLVPTSTLLNYLATIPNFTCISIISVGPRSHPLINFTLFQLFQKISIYNLLPIFIFNVACYLYLQ